MASENETVAEIVKRVRRDCNSYPLPTAAAEMLKLVREIESAHQREVAVVLKDRDEMFKSEQETIAKTNEWFDEYQKLKREVAELKRELELTRQQRNRARLDAQEKFVREVAELRECLKETINAAADAMWWKRGCDKTRNVCTNCGEKDKTFPCPVKRWRKALEGAVK